MTKNPAAVALGSLGGKSKSEAKVRAAKENGKKGGRPLGKNEREKCLQCHRWRVLINGECKKCVAWSRINRFKEGE